MFEYMEDYSKIIVTGPQRSGTTICAEMIAHDLRYTCLRHEKIPNRWTLGDVIWSWEKCVVQCPHLCSYVHAYAQREDVAVVLMRRALEDILTSQERIGWAPYEKDELACYGATKGVIATVKYHFWERYQKHWIWHPYEVEYESLSGHPLWVPNELRRAFEPRQTRCHG